MTRASSFKVCFVVMAHAGCGHVCEESVGRQVDGACALLLCGQMSLGAVQHHSAVHCRVGVFF